MSQAVKGTFASASSVSVGQVSDVLAVPAGTVSMKLTIGDTIDASNTAKTQKTTNGGQTWADQTTYNSAQAAVSVTVAAGEQWRLFLITQQANKVMSYTLSAES